MFWSQIKEISRVFERKRKIIEGGIKLKDVEKTIGNLIDKVGVSFIGSIDSEGFPNVKAMLPPRKREGIKYIYFTTNTSSMRVSRYKEK